MENRRTKCFRRRIRATITKNPRGNNMPNCKDCENNVLPNYWPPCAFSAPKNIKMHDKECSKFTPMKFPHTFWRGMSHGGCYIINEKREVINDIKFGPYD
jgi:hypothetical protein